MLPQSVDDIHPEAKIHWRLLTERCRRAGLTGPQTAYVLATAFHESRLGQWMVDHTNGWAYEGRRRLGNVHDGDGPTFRARGYARLTGRLAYGQWGRHLNLPLVSDPELASVPEVAADILVDGLRFGRFTGHALSEYVNEQQVDYPQARRVMPNRDHPVRIARYARHFEAWLDGVCPSGPTTTEVRRVQTRLRAIGWPVVVNGVLDPYTRRAVRDFQSGYSLTDLPADGCPDPLTRIALDACVDNGGHASPNFRFAEFRTPGCATLSATNRVIRVERRLLDALERYRDLVGRRVRIEAGYRSVDYNLAISGRPDSEHLDGRAVHVAGPHLPWAAVEALGVFTSIGHRAGMAVHLGVNVFGDANEPRVYPLT